MEWADLGEHPGEVPADGFDRHGNPEDIKKFNQQAWKSRGVFALLAVVFTMLFYASWFLVLGLAHDRLFRYNKQEIERITQIFYQYDYVFVGLGFGEEFTIFGGQTNDDGFHEIEKPDAAELEDLSQRLRGHYVSYISYNTSETEEEYLTIGLSSLLLKESLSRYPEEVQKERVEKDYSVRSDDVSQLDAHWWHVR